MTFSRACCRVVLAASLLAGCAAPPLTLYTLGGPAIASGAGAPAPAARVIEIPRVTLPDYLDSEDILVRRGSVLQRSTQGRWATRLSMGVTGLITARLAARDPAVLVTSQPQLEAPAARVWINISRLDVTSDGVATLEADWAAVPRGAAIPAHRERARFTATGPAATDQDVVALEEAVLTQLADAIMLPPR